MDRRVALGVAAVALLAAVGAVFLAPGTGELPAPPPPVEAPRPKLQARAAPSPAPARAARPPAPEPFEDDDPMWDQPPPMPGALVPKIAPRPPVDPDRVYDVEERGIASALFDRHPQLVACYEEHALTFGDVDGRPVVRATVLPEPNEEGTRVEIHIENQGAALDSLDACFAEAMDGANFGPVDIPTTVLQPIPLPARR